MTDCRKQDISYCRPARFENVYAGRSENILPTAREGFDLLFCNERYKQACKDFNKYKIYSDDKSSVVTLFQLDSIVISMVDSF